MDASTVLLLFSAIGFVHSFECPRSNARGLFSNKENCSKYYQCVGGGKYYTKNCPPGLWFDSRYSICNWPGYVSCHAEKPEIQPLASEEEDPVISGKIGRYPQQLGRQIHTTKKTPTYKTSPTTTTKKTTVPATSFQTTDLPASWELEVPRSPQAEKYTTLLDGSTRDPSPGPISSPQSVLEWLYEDHQPDEETEVQNVHPEAPPKEKVEASPINSVAAAMDEYGAFDPDYDDDFFAPPPECSAAFSLMLDPKRCEGFYQCYLWIPYPKVCPAGLLFDHKSNVCNWPEYVYCLNGERYEPPETTTLKPLETTPETPPVPSNNFDPQGNYGYEEDNDTNYDDYWPIRGIEEGDGQQTAFKKKIIPVATSQETTLPQTKTTTFKKSSKISPNIECGDDNKCETQTVQTSDYKSRRKNITSNMKSSEAYNTSTQKDTTTKSTTEALTTKSTTEALTTKSTTEALTTKSTTEALTIKSTTEALTTGSEKLNFPKSPYSKPKDSSASSYPESKSAGKSVESSNSSFASSEEKQTGAESDSSEETNDIIEIKLTSNDLKAKENNIQVEIVPVKDINKNIDDENKLLQQGSAAVSNATSTEITEPVPEPTADPATETTEAPEIDASNATSVEGSGGASNGTSAQSDGNSTESTEGSGVLVVLSKIDTLRNSVEKMLTETKPPAKNLTEVPSTTAFPLNTTEEISKTEANSSSVMSTDGTINSTNTVTDNSTQTETTTPLVLNQTTESASLPHAGISNTTNEYTTSTNNSDIVVDFLNSTTNATTYTPVSDSAAYRANNTHLKDAEMDNKQNIKKDLKTENVTKLFQNDTSFANGTTVEGFTTVTMNISVNETVTDAEFNSTTVKAELSTESTNATNGNESGNVTDATTISSPSSTTVCSGGACNNTDDNTEHPDTQSAAPASSKAVLKPNPSRPDIVMLSGKSPIARILEKLLNIRMKQIGNNKFKAVPDKEKMGKGGLHSENKLPTSTTPKQADVVTNISNKPSKSSKSTKSTPQTTILILTNASIMSSHEQTDVSITEVTTVTTGNTSNGTFTTNVTDLISTDLNNSTGGDTTTGSENITMVDDTDNRTTVMYSTNTSDHTTSDSNPSNTTRATTQEDTTEVTTTATLNITNETLSDNSISTDSETSETTEATVADIHTTQAITNTTQETNDTTTEEIVYESDNVTKPVNTTITVDQLDTDISETDVKNITIGETNDLVISKDNSNSTVLNSTQSSNDSLASTTIESANLNSTQTSQQPMNVTMPPEAMNETKNDTFLQTNITSTSIKSENSTITGTTVNGTTNSTENPTTKTDSASTDLTTEKITTSRKGRGISKLSAEASRFRLHVKAPHFEARKVFGGPDERWRFSDGTLVDPFSRRQRDINTENQMNSASFSPSSFLSIAIMILFSQLA